MAQIQRVEPPFWWQGMHHPTLQVMLYGENISKYDLELSNGLSYEAIQKVENPNYLFVTLDTQKINRASFEFLLKDKGKVVYRQPYELKTRTENSRNRKSFTSADVMYLIMPDRFANGNPDNDNQPGMTEQADRKEDFGRHGGDLQGILDHLDYLEDLGVTTLWLTPVNEANEPKGNYHGYAQTDLYRIDPRYGSNEDYKKLSAELQKRGMKLVMDYVTNHWGAHHWMIQDLPTQDWIHYFPDTKDGFKQSNYRITTQSDTNAADIDRELALDGWFAPSMPDINQENPLVLTYLIQNALWWIEYADLSGFRVDTYPYNNKEAIAAWTKALTDEYPDFNIVGEAWLGTPALIAFWQKDSKVAAIENYNSYLPSIMDFPLFTKLPDALREPVGWGQGAEKLYESFTTDFLFPDINNMLVFFENHDTQRWNEIFEADPKYYKMALSLISTIRGIPQIYYGSEIGMRGNKETHGDGDIRRDFPGGWTGDPQNAFSAETRTPEQADFHDFTQKLLQWRKNKQVIHTGKTKNFVPENNVFVYFRYNDAESVMVVLNSNTEEQTISMDRFKEATKDFTMGKDVLTNEEFKIASDQKLTIAPQTTLILELR